MMGIEVPETCWAYYKCNKPLVASSWFFFSKHMQRCTDKHTSSLALLCLLVFPSLRNNSAPTERILKKIDIQVFFPKLVDCVQVLLKFDKDNEYFTCLRFYVMIILAEFFLEWEMFQTKVVEKVKHTSYVQYFFFLRKWWLLWDKVEKYCTAGQATGDSIIRRMHVVCWITKAINTDSESEILLAFPLQVVARTCLDVALCVYCLSCRSYFWILA